MRVSDSDKLNKCIFLGCKLEIVLGNASHYSVVESLHYVKLSVLFIEITAPFVKAHSNYERKFESHTSSRLKVTS